VVRIGSLVASMIMVDGKIMYQLLLAGDEGFLYLAPKKGKRGLGISIRQAKRCHWSKRCLSKRRPHANAPKPLTKRPNSGSPLVFCPPTYRNTKQDLTQSHRLIRAPNQIHETRRLAITKGYVFTVYSNIPCY
jgi:hypothetical protein